MKKVEYNLDFYEAIKIVMEGGAVKGNNFINGVYLKLSDKGQLVMVYAGSYYAENINVFVKGMINQKFRKLTVMTKKELCKLWGWF